jgi:choline dehydrogenase-like flavoprotein
VQVQTRPQEFDVIVVGSGASGGWAAKRMSEAGLRVALVCAGKPLKDADYTEHKAGHPAASDPARHDCLNYCTYYESENDPA